MNLSGEVVGLAAGFLKVEPPNIVVVHDELDLEFARIQVKVGGGTAGHNGLKSIGQRLGTQDFLRVRLGISRPDPRWDPADYVLSDFTKVEQKELPFLIADAANAVETILKQGTTAAMNRFNRRSVDR
jgi:PTH1 family peptidyl-tRNA hydrolase